MRNDLNLTQTTMQPTCSLIRRPIRRNPWRKWLTITAEIIGGVLTIALLVTLTLLSLAL
jgi:hypothetical protein